MSVALEVVAELRARERAGGQQDGAGPWREEACAEPRPSKARRPDGLLRELFEQARRSG